MTGIAENITTNATATVDTLLTTSFYSLESPIYLLILPVIVVLMAFYVSYGGISKKRLGYLAVRLLIITLITIALASPVHITTIEELGDSPPVTILVDVSPSMSLYEDPQGLGYSLLDIIKQKVGNATGDSSKVKLEMFSPENRTAIGDALYNSFVKYGAEPHHMVLITDGSNNYGKDPLDLAKVMGRANSTVYAVKPVPKSSDLYIQNVFGDKKIPANIDYALRVRVASTALKLIPYELKVFVNDKQRYANRFRQNETLQDVLLSVKMKDVGIQRIRIEIHSDDDSLEANNVYYKTVEVVEKPKILYVTEDNTSPMLKILTRLYDVDATSRVDNDYGKYAGVLFEDINSKDLDRNRVNKIKKYILDGNGVGFIGGKNSFEYGGYNNSFIENLLPVVSSDNPKDDRNPLAIFFLIDVSGSTTYRADSKSPDIKVEIEKAILLRIIKSLDKNDTIGIVAFDQLPYTSQKYYIFPFSQIGDNFDLLQDRVLRLRGTAVMGTSFEPALIHAHSKIRDYPGKKAVIFLSDGVSGYYGSRDETRSIGIAKSMKEDGISLYSIGVGFDVDDLFMHELAVAGGGSYFDTASDERIKLIFGEDEDDDTDLGTSIRIVDNYHYITRELLGLEKFGARVKGFNKVTEKNVAQLLISTKGGKPILTVWPFGLGRVSALSTDNGLLWSSELMKADSGRVVSGMTNWLIGDLEKTREIRVNSHDTHLGQRVDYVVKTSSIPTVRVREFNSQIDHQTVLTKSSFSSYSGSFIPSDSGYWFIGARAGSHFDDDAAAVNYPLEYLDLTIDEDLLQRMSESTGSRLYEATESHLIADEIVAAAMQYSKSEKQTEIQLWHYFALAALVVYFIDAVIRRLMVFFKKEKN